MEDFLSISDFRLALKLSRGSSRRSRAMASSASTSVSSPAGGAEPVRSASSAWSNWSNWFRSGMTALHTRAQILDRAELELLDGSFTAAELQRHFANAALVDETPVDHAPLVVREIVHQTKELSAMFDGLCVRLRARLLRRTALGVIARVPFEMIGDGVGGDTDQPGAEWSAAPFEISKVRERLMEDFRGQVFGGLAIANAARDVCVDQFEVHLVQLAKCGRITARVVYQRAHVGVIGQDFRSRHWSSEYINWRRGEKLWWEVKRSLSGYFFGQGLAKRASCRSSSSLRVLRKAIRSARSCGETVNPAMSGSLLGLS